MIKTEAGWLVDYVCKTDERHDKKGVLTRPRCLNYGIARPILEPFDDADQEAHHAFEANDERRLCANCRQPMARIVSWDKDGLPLLETVEPIVGEPDKGPPPKPVDAHGKPAKAHPPDEH